MGKKSKDAGVGVLDVPIKEQKEELEPHSGRCDCTWLDNVTVDPLGKCVDCGREIFKKGKEIKTLPELNDTAHIAEPFDEYVLARVDIVKQIQSLLEIKLAADPFALMDQLAEIERWRTRSRSFEAFGNSYLDLSERQHILPPDRSSYTDEDRRVHLAAACNRERRFRDVCAGLVEGIDRKISLGQSMLRKHEEFARQGA